MRHLLPVLTLLLLPATAVASEQTFTYTGAEESFLVPSGVRSIHVVAIGARGGTQTGSGGGAGGLGGKATADLSVTPGTTLYVDVGGVGTVGGNATPGGFNGGGAGTRSGGGASDVRTLPSSQAASLDTRLVVAGGGGGGGLAASSTPVPNGGAGGGTTGGAGGVTSQPGCPGVPDAAGGGTQTAGGGHALTLGDVGDGAFGRGGTASPDSAGEGGGGGWWGGGAAGFCRGGGGGSGHFGTGTSNTSFDTSTEAAGVTFTFVQQAPAVPTVTGSAPVGPANENAPRIRGVAEPGSTVNVYPNGSCTGTPVATGTAADFEGAGLTVNVTDNSITTFAATASNAVGASTCSTTSVTYQEVSSVATPVPTVTAPDTTITKRPKKTVRTAKKRVRVRFSFTSGDPKATFRCKLDTGRERACDPGVRYRVRRGRHRFRVVAVLAGVRDPTPASASFIVKRKGKR